MRTSLCLSCLKEYRLSPSLPTLNPEAPPLFQDSPEATTFTFILHELAKVFAENADFGAQVQKLFIGNREEVKSSAMFLSQQPSEYAPVLVEERVSLEKDKTTPDVEIIDFLSRML